MSCVARLTLFTTHLLLYNGCRVATLAQVALLVRLLLNPLYLRRSRNFLQVALRDLLLRTTRVLSTRVGPMRLIPVAPTHYAFTLTYILGIRSCLITPFIKLYKAKKV